jgi:dihydroflavonol-4-reductase
VILRPPAVYGPRDTDMLELFRTVQRGIILSLGRGERWQSLVHVRDVVRGALLAATAQEASGRIYNLCSPKPIELGYVQDIIANAVGVKARRIVVPSLLIYPVAWWRQVRGRMVGRAPILSLQKLPEILARYWVLDHESAERELGFRAEIGLEEGIRETVDWYRSVGWLS